ncbi:hypothetical protein ACH4S8_37520 [Streptomyces sp. NPDC021080]|uniref:hypothetical protein n=1 Tax=Streptomyces sp. NPDC021080 TaxID=3365110 RepID=UPI0037A86E2F
MENESDHPAIIEPYEDTRQADPALNVFVLYDEDFAEETDLRYKLTDPEQKLYKPHFSIGGIAPWVFGRNDNWLRNTIKNHPPHLRGAPLRFRFITGRANRPERRLTLPDIERLAWALYGQGAIDGYTLQSASRILTAVAHQYGGLTDANGKKIT